jgi:flagellar protein FliS
MFTSVSSRSASAYQRISVETVTGQTSQTQLVNLCLEGVLKNVGAARAAMQRGDIPTKGKHIVQAVRIIDEGLRPALDLEKGGDIAANLNGLYGYCVLRLTEANLRNDEQALADVIRVMEPLADGWKQMNAQGVTETKPTH